MYCGYRYDMFIINFPTTDKLHVFTFTNCFQYNILQNYLRSQFQQEFLKLACPHFTRYIKIPNPLGMVQILYQNARILFEYEVPRCM